ncbi:MAG TPA: hypothetical protein PLA50_04885, partial [Bacteroidia bacterium]|nr:hypothetical protein [Bacteroidia bacterium]
SIQKAANDAPTTEKRYRAAWWALKLQDNQECFHQLTLANEEAGKPVLEIEKMLFSLAEQNERTPLMVRHLTNLIELDPEHADEYRQKRALARFELGFEDEAVRELKALAAKPEPPLSTLNALATLYQRQGSPGKQIELWRRAYREADLFEKRTIIKQLSTALIESGQPEEALKAQIDLLGRENDQVQRRKQLDTQIAVAQAHYLLDWMREQYSELASRHPFDRFYPEALARVHRAAGNDREAYEAMKKAYYMSGQSEELLGELGALSDRLGDLESAIYFRRQLLARGEGDSLENWKALVGMLEKDLRIDEADQLRQRLETKFGSDIDFLAELTDHYWKTGRHRDAQRTLERLVALRGWDLDARFRLGLLQVDREEFEAAYATFSALLDDTEETAYPPRFGDRLLPLVRVAASAGATRGASGDRLQPFVFTVEGYPFMGGNLQNKISESLQQTHEEFSPLPKEPHLLRLRAIEEAASLAARLGRVPEWLRDHAGENRPRFERLWATRHAGATGPYLALLADYPDTSSHTDQLLLAYSHLLGGDVRSFLAWTKEENAASGTSHPRSLYGTMAALILLKDNSHDPLFRIETIYEVLAELPVSKTVASHIFAELRKAGRYEETCRIGEIFASGPMADEPTFAYYLSHAARLAGRSPEEAERWLDRSLQLDAPDAAPRIASHTYVALTEKLTLLDTDADRVELLRQLGSRYSTLSGERERIDAELLLALAAKDTGALVRGIGSLLAYQSRTTLPASAKPEDLAHEQSQNWQRIGRLLQYYADRLPFDAASAPAFHDAFGERPLLNPADAVAAAQFEQFEIDRGLLPLEWLNAPERAALLRELAGALREPDSRMELAKALENRGFHREAVSVYRNDTTLRDRDYAPLQGLFDAAAEALDPAPALALIDQINTREFPAPPGLTVDYLNEQHARFLLLDGNLDRLWQLSRVPAVRAGSPPVASHSHLPYQAALAEGYRRFGKDEALLRLLSELRTGGTASGPQLLLGAETLAGLSRHEEALEWLAPLAADPADSSLQRRAMLMAVESHRALGWKQAKALRTLALASFERQPAFVTREIVAALREAKAYDEATGILSMLRRGTADRHQRTLDSIELLQTQQQAGKGWPELRDELEAFFHDFAYRLESDEIRLKPANPTVPTVREAPPALVRPTAYRFAEWITAADDKEALAETLAGLSVPGENRWLADLTAASLDGRLEDVVRARMSDLPTGHQEREWMLETLPAFGTEGVETARRLIEDEGRPGPALFPGQPDRQIALYLRLGDRGRLLETHAQLVRETKSDFFHQQGLEDWIPTLENRRRIPTLLAAAGETELAGSLFRACNDAIPSYRWNHVAFLDDYAAFLIGSGAHEEAATLLRRVLQKSLRTDLRLLPRLYAASGRTGDWEARSRELHLSRGQEILLREWMTALAEGRELRETRDAW